MLCTLYYTLYTVCRIEATTHYVRRFLYDVLCTMYYVLCTMDSFIRSPIYYLRPANYDLRPTTYYRRCTKRWNFCNMKSGAMMPEKRKLPEIGPYWAKLAENPARRMRKRPGVRESHSQGRKMASGVFFRTFRFSVGWALFRNFTGSPSTYF